MRELSAWYRGFRWESQVWAEVRPRRSPYRAVILFGLSPRTSDGLLVNICRRFFEEFPDLHTLIQSWPQRRGAIERIVRAGQVPFVESVVEITRSNGGTVPRHRQGLLAIKGVGEKVAECVLAYGWGAQALPIDGNVCRFISRVVGREPHEENLDAAVVRGQLKRACSRNDTALSEIKIAMVDVHEILRLHAQTTCLGAPICEVCPLSNCHSRRKPFADGTAPTINFELWEEWRELLLDPA